jgi:hypothetical protein
LLWLISNNIKNSFSFVFTQFWSCDECASPRQNFVRVYQRVDEREPPQRPPLVTTRKLATRFVYPSTGISRSGISR